MRHRRAHRGRGPIIIVASALAVTGSVAALAVAGGPAAVTSVVQQAESVIAGPETSAPGATPGEPTTDAGAGLEPATPTTPGPTTPGEKTAMAAPVLPQDDPGTSPAAPSSTTATTPGAEEPSGATPSPGVTSTGEGSSPSGPSQESPSPSPSVDETTAEPAESSGDDQPAPSGPPPSPTATQGSDGGWPVRTFATMRLADGQEVSYHYHPASTDAESTGLLVWLDGDGQWGFDHPWSTYVLGGPEGVVAQANARGLDVLSIRAPSTDDMWWTRCSANADLVHEAITLVRAENGVGAEDTWVAAFSGGAQLTTQCYLPRHGRDLVGGGAIVFGGGGRPTVATANGLDASAREGVSLTWITGTEDLAENSEEDYDGLAYARAGHSWYADAGYDTTSTWVPGVDHEGFDSEFGAYVGRVLDRARG